MHRSIRVGAVVALLAAAAACDRPPTVTIPPTSAQFDSLVAESMRDGKVPGLALSIVHGDTLVHSQGYGLADLEREQPMTDSTPVVIGSASKAFTAVAIMQLAERGRLALDSSIARYIALLGAPHDAGSSAVAVAVPADPRFVHITVRQLLTHTAGIPAGFSGDAFDDVDTTAGALARLVRDDILPRPLDFAPGARYRYSNRGFSLASLAVQDVSGLAFEDYIDDRILKPLGMRHSTARFWEGPARGMVQGYRASLQGTPLPRPASLGREWTGSGMILSTSRDAVRFLQALLDSGRAPGGSQLLSAAGVAELLRPQQQGETGAGGRTMQAFGGEVGELSGVRTITKGGSVGTMGSLLVLVPSRRIGVALVFNSVDESQVQLAHNIVKLLLGLPPAPFTSAPTASRLPHGTHRLAADRARAIAGVYDTRGGVMRITVRGDTLRARFEGNDLTLEATSDSSFVMRSVLRDQEGTALVIRPCGARLCMWMNGDSSAVRR